MHSLFVFSMHGESEGLETLYWMGFLTYNLCSERPKTLKDAHGDDSPMHRFRLLCHREIQHKSSICMSMFTLSLLLFRLFAGQWRKRAVQVHLPGYLISE